MTSFLKSSTLVKNVAKDHQNNLLNAARGLFKQDKNVAKQENVIEIYSGEHSEKILFNKKLLLLFSKTIRSCFAEDPCCAPQPSLIVPTIPGKIVAKIQEILLKTVFDEQINFDDVDLEQIVDAAELLGIEIKNIRVMANFSRKKKEMVKPALAMQEPEVVDVFDEDKPLQINVDISSDEEDGNDFDSDEEGEMGNVDMGNLAVQNTSSKFLTNSVASASGQIEAGADLILKGTPEIQEVGHSKGVTSLLEEDEDSDNDSDDEDESLQEESEEAEPSTTNEKISFSFLKKEYNSDGSITTATTKDMDSVSNALQKLQQLQQVDTETVATNFENQGDVKGDEQESGKSSEDVGLKCKLCEKPQKGPSALREHYASTHFFQELYDIYVKGTSSETWCTMEGCNKDYRDRKCLVRHIGSTHHKVGLIDY